MADIAHPDNRPFLALFFQAFGVALYHPERNAELFQRLGGECVAEVQQALEAEAMPADRAQVLATQLVTEWRGLQVSLLRRAPRDLLDAFVRRPGRPPPCPSRSNPDETPGPYR